VPLFYTSGSYLESSIFNIDQLISCYVIGLNDDLKFDLNGNEITNNYPLLLNTEEVQTLGDLYNSKHASIIIMFGSNSKQLVKNSYSILCSKTFILLSK